MHPDINCFPDIKILSQMTESELSKVKELILENQYGKIEYIEPVDLRFVNFRKDV